MPSDALNPPTRDDARALLASVRACLGAGRAPSPEWEAKAVEVIYHSLDCWHLRGRAAAALAGAHREEQS